MRNGRSGRTQFENPRSLKHKVDFYSTPEVKNDFGEAEAGDLILLFDARAEVLSLDVENGTVSEGLQRQSNITLRFRYISAINESLTMLFNSEYYEIQSIENVGASNVELMINASKFIQNNGD